MGGARNFRLGVPTCVDSTPYGLDDRCEWVWLRYMEEDEHVGQSEGHAEVRDHQKRKARLVANATCHYSPVQPPKRFVQPKYFASLQWFKTPISLFSCYMTAELHPGLPMAQVSSYPPIPPESFILTFSHLICSVLQPPPIPITFHHTTSIHSPSQPAPPQSIPPSRSQLQNHASTSPPYANYPSD